MLVPTKCITKKNPLILHFDNNNRSGYSCFLKLNAILPSQSKTIENEEKLKAKVEDFKARGTKAEYAIDDAYDT